VLTALTHLTDAWAALYSDSALLRTAIGFAHVAGLVAGGGSAVVADRSILRAARRRADPEAREQLVRLHAMHRGVILGLGVVIASGLLLFASDVDTYVHSWVFWTKMVAVGGLFLNGAVVMAAERGAAHGHPRGWDRLVRASTASLALWFLTTLLGAALPNV
jgi:hypothetical protein